MISTDNHEPYKKFDIWYQYAKKYYSTHSIENVNAMVLATVGSSLIPSVRMVLLKSYDEKGFTFYTNLESSKAQSIKENNQVSLLFYWLFLKRQIRISGKALRIAQAKEELYFTRRPYLSKIGAWASLQSKEMLHGDDLQKRVTQFSLEFKETVPKPESWGGFIVNPDYFEFWEEKPARLHHRVAYTLINKMWHSKILYP